MVQSMKYGWAVIGSREGCKGDVKGTAKNILMIEQELSGNPKTSARDM